MKSSGGGYELIIETLLQIDPIHNLYLITVNVLAHNGIARKVYHKYTSAEWGMS